MIDFTHSYADLPNSFFQMHAPEPVPAPELLLLNEELATELGLDLEWLQSADGLGLLSGNALPDSARPIALAYAGHQFGNFVPRLGDGRALLLGEISGKDLQLKGSGRTSFSRGGDGKSALGPVIREYLVSEAMHALGVPTTRALAAVSTGEAVHRQEGPVPGGIFSRIASSHIRVGTFQYFLARQDHEALRSLADYTITRHYPREKSYLELLNAVIAKQADLIAHWMSLGFIHGVMNTDNCAVSGETIDFGPCAFMDNFHPQTVFSSIDHGGRYSWENQARIGHWNLTRFAECLLPLIGEDRERAIQQVKESLQCYAPLFKEHYIARFRAKLGLKDAPECFIDETLSLLAQHKLDFTLFFRNLTRQASGTTSGHFHQLGDWTARWRAQGEIDAALMQTSNPVLIPRNHRIEEAIKATYEGHYDLFRRLNTAWKTPFDETGEYQDLEAPPTEAERVRETFCGT